MPLRGRPPILGRSVTCPSIQLALRFMMHGGKASSDREGIYPTMGRNSEQIERSVCSEFWRPEPLKKIRSSIARCAAITRHEDFVQNSTGKSAEPLDVLRHQRARKQNG